MATTPSATSPNSEIEIQALLTTVETPTITAPPTVNNNNPSAEDPLNKASSENEPMESEPCNNSSPRRVTPTSSASHSSSHSRRGRTESGVIRTARGTSRSPRTNPYPDPITIGNTTNRARRLVYARRWGWLSTTLDTWRNVEGIRISAEPMDISPYTQEPMHHTVPVLAARLSRHEDRLDDIQMEQYRHEERLDAMEQEQRETRHNWMHLAQGRVAQIYQNQEDITETMGIVHNQVIGNRNEISVLQTRLEQCETRLRETEETLRMVGRLTETMERVVTLLPPPNPR